MTTGWTHARGVGRALRSAARSVVVVLLAASVVLVLPASGHALADPSTIPAGGRGTVTVHLPRSASTAAEQVAGRFTARRVIDVDLRTAGGWESAAQFQSGAVQPRPARLGGPIVAAPGGPGEATTIRGLEVGLYLVRREPSPTPVPGGPASPVSVREVFVTIPQPDPQHPDLWVYDVDIHHKLSVTQISKTVRDAEGDPRAGSALVAGHVLSYQLVADIPSRGMAAFGGRCLRNGAVDTRPALDVYGFTVDGWCARGASYEASGADYQIIDDLATSPIPGTDMTSADVLEFTADDWSGSVSLAIPGGSTLVRCVSDDACDYRLTLSPDRVAIALTRRGLTALALAKRDDPRATVVAGIDARLVGGDPAPIEDLTFRQFVVSVPNTAHLVHGGTGGQSMRATSDTVRTIYGTLQVHKVDTSGHSLPGATFTLYRTRASAEARRDPLAVSTPGATPGSALFRGVRVTDFGVNAPAESPYWMIETSAPPGYFGIRQPIEVRLDSDGRTVGADATGGIPVANSPDGRYLARTGAEVAGLLLLAGLLIMGGMSLVRFGTARRRRREPGR